MGNILMGIKLILKGQIRIISLLEDIKEEQTGSTYSFTAEETWKEEVNHYIKNQ